MTNSFKLFPWIFLHSNGRRHRFNIYHLFYVASLTKLAPENSEKYSVLHICVLNNDIEPHKAFQYGIQQQANRWVEGRGARFNNIVASWSRSVTVTAIVIK